MRVDWGNAPQWVSALCAALLASIAIYGVFFSATSHAFVAYLQSELAVRNQRIASLELQERDLLASVARTKMQLAEIEVARKVLADSIEKLSSDRQALASEIAAIQKDLASAQFLVIKEKIGAELSSKVVSITTFTLSQDFWTNKDGVRGTKEKPWKHYISFVQETARKLPESDRVNGQLVVAEFIKRCGRYENMGVDIPNLKIGPDEDFAKYNYDRSAHPSSINLEAIIEKIRRLETEIRNCFHGITPNLND